MKKFQNYLEGVLKGLITSDTHQARCAYKDPRNTETITGFAITTNVNVWETMEAEARRYLAVCAHFGIWAPELDFLPTLYAFLKDPNWGLAVRNFLLSRRSKYLNYDSDIVISACVSKMQQDAIRLRESQEEFVQQRRLEKTIQPRNPEVLFDLWGETLKTLEALSENAVPDANAFIFWNGEEQFVRKWNGKFVVPVRQLEYIIKNHKKQYAAYKKRYAKKLWSSDITGPVNSMASDSGIEQVLSQHNRPVLGYKESAPTEQCQQRCLCIDMKGLKLVLDKYVALRQKALVARLPTPQKPQPPVPQPLVPPPAPQPQQQLNVVPQPNAKRKAAAAPKGAKPPAKKKRKAVKKANPGRRRSPRNNDSPSG